MSVFSFPRINVKGLVQYSPGTGNNDDYSDFQFPTVSPPLAGQPLRLADSVNVRPLTFGMADAEWLAWAQWPHPFVKAPRGERNDPCDTPGQPHDSPRARDAATKAEGPRSLLNEVQQVPVEWNYYGDMSVEMVNVRVIGVQYPDRLAVSPADDNFVGATLSFNNRVGEEGRTTAMMIDINPEDVPCSQVFADSLLLEKDGQRILQGEPSKAVTRWINLQRNAALKGPNGAAGSFHCVVPIEKLKGKPILDWLSKASQGSARPSGLVFRYCLFRSLQPISMFQYDYDQNRWALRIAELYRNPEWDNRLNPTYLQVIGTIAPWYEGEMRSIPVGRLLNPTSKYFCLPPDRKGKTTFGRAFFLAPAVAWVDLDKSLLSVDFSATFPDDYKGQSGPDYDPFKTDNNGKYDFGPVTLVVRKDGHEHEVGRVRYEDTDAGDQHGWIFDFSFRDASATVSDVIKNGTLALKHAQSGDLLLETEYMLASDQSCIVGEQVRDRVTTDLFMNEGPKEEQCFIRVFQKGQELSTAACPDISVWEYDTTPNQQPGDRRRITASFKPGQPLVVNTERAGNQLYTFTLPGAETPPPTYGDFDPQYLMTIPQVNLRLLPNDRDYSKYYENPHSSEPVGNAGLTFDVIYNEVLRNYYLLYPAMSRRVPLNEPEWWADPEMAGRMLLRTQKDLFGTWNYMPRTRDLSETRRRLLQAWCRKILGMRQDPQRIARSGDST